MDRVANRVHNRCNLHSAPPWQLIAILVAAATVCAGQSASSPILVFATSGGIGGAEGAPISASMPNPALPKLYPANIPLPTPCSQIPFIQSGEVKAQGFDFGAGAGQGSA